MDTTHHLSRRPATDADVIRLCAEQQAELRRRYGAPEGDAEMGAAIDPQAIVSFVLAYDAHGDAVGCAALAHAGHNTGELKRMYVAPAARRAGLGRTLLHAIEDLARDTHIGRIILESGTEQPESLRLYAGAGYTPIPNYGDYAESTLSRCFEKHLDTAATDTAVA